MKSALETLASQWDKEAAAWLASAPVPEGARPDQVTPMQQCAVHHARVYRGCARDLRELILKQKTVTK